jgi:hypothetical protein
MCVCVEETSLPADVVVHLLAFFGSTGIGAGVCVCEYICVDVYKNINVDHHTNYVARIHSHIHSHIHTDTLSLSHTHTHIHNLTLLLTQQKKKKKKKKKR